MKCMHYVYVLWSKTQKKFYIGYTADLGRRLQEHKRESDRTIQRLGGAELIFYEAFLKEGDARRREEYLKTTKGKKTLKLMLQGSFCPVV